MIPATLTIPQYYGLWCREQTEGLSHAAAVELINKRRARKGLPPLTDGLPDCCKPPPAGYVPPVR